MTSAKKMFGEFVTEKRQAAGLTQRDLAARLFVTESAVSKWERGVSYPDISLIVALSQALGVSESELVNASDDLATRRIEREAKVYRAWKASVFWTFAVGYAVAVLTCFIVNLSVDHGLTWFWVVLTGVAVAFSLTTLPLLPVPRRGWTVLAAFLVSLFALLAVVYLLYGSGSWLPIAVVSVLFAALVVLGPVVLHATGIPGPLGRHRTVLVLLVDTVGLGILLLVIFAALGDLHTLATRALPIAGLAAVFAWAAALVIRYVPVNGLFKAAIVLAFTTVYDRVVFNPLVARVVGERQDSPTDLTDWHEPYINGNVSLLSLLAGLLVAVILAVVGGVVEMGRSRRS